MSERTALFVRVPSELAADLDSRAQRSGRSKQDLVTEMLSDAPAAAAERARIDRDGNDDILNLDEVAALLRVDPSDILERITDGGFPGRRFGQTWRFSRAAISAWLAGTDPIEDRRTGFEAAPA